MALSPKNQVLESIMPISGSTAKILVTLYKQAMHFTDLPANDPILKRATALEAKTTQIFNKIDTITHIDNNLADINLNISKLEILDRSKPPAQQRATIFKPEYQNLQATLNYLKTKHADLDKQYREIAHTQRETFRELINQKKLVTDSVKNQKLPTQVQRILINMEKDLTKFNKEVDNYASEKASLERKVEILLRASSFGLKSQEQIAPTAIPGITPPKSGG